MYLTLTWLCLGLLMLMMTSLAASESGCASSSSDKGFPDTRISACTGQWVGHIRHASSLCGAGWEVCDYKQHGDMLSKISWTVAMSVDGCFAYNAAQDGGRCQECKDDLTQDDLAGMGSKCPQQQQGLTSCISGGRIDASCCVDSHVSINKACQQQPWIDGVMCCRQTARKPQIIVLPPQRIDVNVGEIFMLSCQAEGFPTPRVQWYKDGAKVSTNHKSRISVITSTGDLLVTLADRSDTGTYTCEVINEEGIDIAHTQVFVQDHESGCADGTTEGLSMHKNIHACAGRWKGHVKQGDALCRAGWRVCSSEDNDRLRDLSWLDILDTKGCFAYNVGNDRRGKCGRCRSSKSRMAGLGQSCGRYRYAKPSCLAKGRIDVFKTRDELLPEDRCSYVEGRTTGVVCCKRNKKKKDRQKNEIGNNRRPYCSLGCENGGQCVGYNVCMCPVGYKGAMCQNAVCIDPCGPRGKCVSPGKCECIQPYYGENCSQKRQTRPCPYHCLNGGRCRHRRCKCPPMFYGSSCQHQWNIESLATYNRTEK